MTNERQAYNVDDHRQHNRRQAQAQPVGRRLIASTVNATSAAMQGDSQFLSGTMHFRLKERSLVARADSKSLLLGAFLELYLGGIESADLPGHESVANLVCIGAAIRLGNVIARYNPLHVQGCADQERVLGSELQTA